MPLHRGILKEFCHLDISNSLNNKIPIQKFGGTFRKFFGLVGGESPPDAPLNGHPQDLIEAAKRGRLDQMMFFSAPLTTRAPPGRPAGRPAERPAERPTCRQTPPKYSSPGSDKPR